MLYNILKTALLSKRLNVSAAKSLFHSLFSNYAINKDLLQYQVIFINHKKNTLIKLPGYIIINFTIYYPRYAFKAPLYLAFCNLLIALSLI